MQATRGKQEVTTELAKILTVLKTTLQNDKDSSSSDDEAASSSTPVKNPMPTGKPPRPPFKPRAKVLASISPAIQAKIKELEQSKTSNPKEEMNLLSKILVHLLCSCKTAAAAQELKAVIKQFKEVAKVAMEEGDDTLEALKCNSRPTSRASSRRKVRSRTASGNSNISGNSETDSINTLTPGDSKSSGTDDETAQDSNLSKLRFTSNVVKKDDVESCVSYTLTLPLARQQDAEDPENYDEGDEEWEWEYDEELDASTPTKQESSGSSRNLTPSEGKSDVSTGSTRKLLTEMEMGAYNCSSTSQSDHGNSQSTPITEEEDYSDDDNDHDKKAKAGTDQSGGNLFGHLEETFKVLSDTYKIITTGNNSPECGNVDEQGNVLDEGFEGLLDVISNQCVQIETEIKKTSRQSTPARCNSTPPRCKSASSNSRPSSRVSSRPGSKMSRPGSRQKSKASTSTDDGLEDDEDWGDEDQWEYYYEEDYPEGNDQEPGKISRPVSRQKVQSRPQSRQKAPSRQGEVCRPPSVAKVPSRPASVAKAPSRPASRNDAINEPVPTNAAGGMRVVEDWDYEEWGDPDEWEYYYEDEVDDKGKVNSGPVSRAASRQQSRAPSRQEPISRAVSRQDVLEKSRAPSRQDPRAPSKQESCRVPSRQELSRAQSRQEPLSRAASRQEPSRAPSRQDQAPSKVDPIRVSSRQEVPRAAEIVAEIKEMGERVPSRLRVVSRPASRAKSVAEEEGQDWEWDTTGEDWEGYEGEWEYYYEGDYNEEAEQTEVVKQEPPPPPPPAINVTKAPAIVVNKDPRSNSRQSTNSRPNSRSGSRPTSRTGSRAASRILRNPSALGSVYEEDDQWDDEYDEHDELGRLSPTSTYAPTTRATSPFPDEKGVVDQNTGSGFSNRRCSIIQESEESTPRPSTVISKTPTNRESATPKLSRPVSKQSNPESVGYLTRTAGVSVALAAEYLGQDAIKLAANLPQEFIEENIVKEKKKKKHRRKESDSPEEIEYDENGQIKKKKKKKNKDGKFLPKVGVRELANRLEGELFQDNAVGARMVISKDEVRDVIRETKKKAKSVNRTLEDNSKPGTPNRHSPPDKEEKRKSVKEMVQILSTQQMQEQMAHQYNQQQSQYPNSSMPPPPVPPPPQNYYSSPSPSQYPPNYQPYPVEVRPQYPPYQQDYQGYPPQHPYQQYQQQYHAYQGYPPPPPPHYQGYPPPQGYQQYPPQYPQGYPPQQYPPQYQPQPPQPMIYQTENPNQLKVVSGGQTQIVNMRSKSTGPRQKEARNSQARSPDSEAYGTGSSGSDGTENQVAGIDHDEGAEQEPGAGGKQPHKRHSRLFKLLQDSDYTDSDTDSRAEFSSRISMKNVEDNHGKESDIDSVCSGLERKVVSIDRKHSFRSHKSSNKESDNDSVTSSGVERKLSPNSMQRAVTTRRFMQLSLNQEYEQSSSEVSTPNSPTAAVPQERRRSTSKPPARVWKYHADDFDSHAGTSDDSSYQSLQSLNSFDSINQFNDNIAGREVEEIMKRKVQRDGLYRYSTDSPHNYVTASPKTVEMLRNSPKINSNSPKFDTYQRASPKIEQELMELANFPSSPGMSLRHLHSHRSFYSGGGMGQNK